MPRRSGAGKDDEPAAALYRLAFDAAPTALLLLDREGRLVAANRAAARLPFHAPPGGGEPFAFLWPRSVRPAMARWLEQVGAAPGSGFEVAVPAAGGEVLLELVGCEVEGPDGPLREILVQDVTERRRLDRRAAQAERLVSLGSLAATLAHEIRNALAGVDGALQVFQLDEEIAPPRREILDEMRGRIARLRDVVDDLISYARPPRLALHPWPVEEVLQAMSVAAADHPQLREVRVRVVNACPPDVLVGVDVFHLRLVARNLIVNAAQAMDGRGEVVLEAGRAGAEVLFRFRDEGPGIDPADEARVFEPFFTTRTGGTGLGLPIAANVVAAHGGQLTLQRGGPGATFVAALPVHPAGPAAR